MILILSDESDVHALAVQNELNQLGERSRIFDVRELPNHWDLSTCLGEGGTSEVRLKSRSSREDFFSGLKSVWWRRPRRIGVDRHYNHPAIADFAKREWLQAWIGSLAMLNVKMVNPLRSRELSRYKPLQLKLARKNQLVIPSTLITNDVVHAREFISSNENAIYKPFTGVEFGFYETRRIKTKDDIDQLPLLAECPIILQEEIKGEYDLRATYVAGDIFCVSVDYKSGRHGVDSRVESLPLSEYALPIELKDKLRVLMADLGLIYGTIDLRKRLDGEYVFFEVNPDGQYLWTEIEGNLPISAAVAKCLAY